MWGLIIAALIGLGYGYMSPGRTDKSRLFMRGLLWGLVVAAVLAIVGYFVDMNPLGLGDAGFWSLFLSFIVITLAFVVGVWIGDAIEHRRAPAGGLRRV